MQINPNMAIFLTIEIKEDQITFPKFIFVLSLYFIGHLSGNPGKFLVIDFFLQQGCEARTVNSLFIHPADSVRNTNPVINEPV